MYNRQQYCFTTKRFDRKKSIQQQLSKQSHNNSQHSKKYKKPPQVKIDLGPRQNLILNMSQSRSNKLKDHQYINKLKQQLEEYKVQNMSLKQENRQFRATQEILTHQIVQLKQQKNDHYSQQQYQEALLQQTLLKYAEKIKTLYQQLIKEKKKAREKKIPQSHISYYQEGPFHCPPIQEPLWEKIEREGEKAYYSSLQKKLKLGDGQYYLKTESEEKYNDLKHII